MVRHEGVVGDGAAKAHQHGYDVLIEGGFCQRPWLKHAGKEHQEDCQGWQQVGVNVPCTARVSPHWSSGSDRAIPDNELLSAALQHPSLFTKATNLSHCETGRCCKHTPHMYNLQRGTQRSLRDGGTLTVSAHIQAPHACLFLAQVHTCPISASYIFVVLQDWWQLIKPLQPGAMGSVLFTFPGRMGIPANICSAILLKNEYSTTNITTTLRQSVKNVSPRGPLSQPLYLSHTPALNY